MGQAFSYLTKFYDPFSGTVKSREQVSALFQGSGVFLAVILLVLTTSGAVQTLYFEHDDWPFMTRLLPDMASYISPWDKTLSEGRWVNWLWSLEARTLPARFLYCLYMLGYSLFCWLAACLMVSKTPYRILLAFLLFFSVPFSILSLWPATLTPMVWLSALFIFSVLTLGFNVFLFSVYNILIFLSYSPMISSVTLLVLAVFPFFCLEIVLFYGLSYLAGILTSFSLNKIFHGTFGIVLEGWRHPHPVHGLNDFRINSVKASKFWIESFQTYEMEFVISFFLIISAFYFNRKTVIQFILGAGLVFLCESLLQVFSGADSPVRSTYWIWCFFIGAFAIFIRTVEPDTRWKGCVILTGALPILCSGGLLWFRTIQGYAKVSQYESYLGNRIVSTGATTVYVCGDVQTVPALKYQAYRAVRLAMWKQYAVNLQPGPEAVCSAVAAFPWTDIQVMPDHSAVVRFPAGTLDTQAY